MNRGQFVGNVNPETMDRARRLVEDGASVTEIKRTTGLARETILKYFPGSAWTCQQAGTHGAVIRHMERRIP